MESQQLSRGRSSRGWYRSVHLPCLLGLFCLLGCSAELLPYTDTPNIATKPLRNVCLVYYEAIVYCDASQPPSNYSGYEVDLFKKTVNYMYTNGRAEWAPENYTLTCMDWDSMMEDLLQPESNRTCDVGVAGISATSDRMNQGYRFTSPDYDSGRLIMLYMPSTVDPFLFLKPFSPDVWLLMFATSLFVGIAVLFAEVPLRRILKHPEPAFDKYMNLQWAATTMLLQAMQQFSAKSAGARVIVLGYAFLVVILINIYIAVLSSQLTVSSINLQINGLSDLVDKPVGIFEADSTVFKRFNLNYVVDLPWNNADDEQHMIDTLRSGKITALVLDAPFVQYQVAASCDLYTVGDLILPNNLGFAFPSETPLDYVEMFDEGLTYMQETGVMDDLKQVYITPSGCPSKGQSLSTTTIGIKDISGLWAFLGAAVILGYMINTLTWLIRKCRGKPEKKSPGALGGGSVSFGRTSSQVSPVGGGSVAGQRSMSFYAANPDMSWVSVADASTTEEAMEVMEAHVRMVDQRLKKMADMMEQRFAILNENLFGINSGAMNGKDGMMDGRSTKPDLHQKSLSVRAGEFFNGLLGSGSSSGRPAAPAAEGKEASGGGMPFPPAARLTYGGGPGSSRFARGGLASSGGSGNVLAVVSVDHPPSHSLNGGPNSPTGTFTPMYAAGGPTIPLPVMTSGPNSYSGGPPHPAASKPVSPGAAGEAALEGANGSAFAQVASPRSGAGPVRFAPSPEPGAASANARPASASTRTDEVVKFEEP